MSTMEKPRDVIGGVLVIGIGAGFLLFGRELEMGTSFRMGPGYFPTILSALMIILGLAMVALAWRESAQEDAIGRVPWMAMALVVMPVVLFGLCLRALGLLPILVVVVLATAWASRYASLKASVLLAVGIATFCSSCSSRRWACHCRCWDPCPWSARCSISTAGGPPLHRPAQ